MFVFFALALFIFLVIAMQRDARVVMLNLSIEAPADCNVQLPEGSESE